jgi:MFS family permease
MLSNRRSSSPWVILSVVFFASVAAPLNQFKVPPVMPVLMQAFSLPPSKAGLLMSVFAITGLFLAIPAGLIFRRLGCRITGAIALLSITVGAGIGALSRNMETMLFSRLIEGIGLSLIYIVAPAVIAVTFEPARRGRAMGIWSAWFPLGQLVGYIVVPQIASSWGWRSAWWFGCLYAGLTGMLFYLLVKPASQRVESGAPDGFALNDMRQLLSNRDLWLLSLTFCCFNFAFISFRTWMPTFLYSVRGLSLVYASLLIGLMSPFAVIASPLSGWISDKIRSRKLICVLPLLASVVMFPISPAVSTSLLVPWMVALGLISGFAPTGVILATTELGKDGRFSGMALAIMQLGQHVGTLLGPAAVGWTIELTENWQAGFWTLGPVCAIGAAAAWITRVK